MGTAATTTLTALAFNPSMAPADFAAIDAAILDDLNPAHPNNPGGWARNGQLFVPNRGVLLMLPGDFVAFDTQTGWPILISARAGGQAGWVHS
jgi:hypothetical protein